jgi:hypothetical protein
MVLWLLLTSAASAWFHNQGYRSRLLGRPPQVRTLTFPAPLPHLLLRPLVASGFVVMCQLARPHSLIRFVFLKSQVCFRLPPDPASRRRLCLPLAVGATNLRKGLSPSSQHPCWAHTNELGPLRSAQLLFNRLPTPESGHHDYPRKVTGFLPRTFARKPDCFRHKPLHPLNSVKNPVSDFFVSSQ